MEILTVLHNPMINGAALAVDAIANRNGAPIRSPLVRLHEILAESNSSDETLAFLPMRRSATGRA